VQGYTYGSRRILTRCHRFQLSLVPQASNSMALEDKIEKAVSTGVNRRDTHLEDVHSYYHHCDATLRETEEKSAQYHGVINDLSLD